MTGAQFAATAEALAGTRFRLHGRDPHTGLDCLGLIAAALASNGRAAALPVGYTLRRRGLDEADTLAGTLGLGLARGKLAAGDLLLALCSPVQPHLVVALGGERIVHAHAGLGRVVVDTCDPAWTIVRHWRFPHTD